MTATAQNIKRLVKLLSRGGLKVEAMAMRQAKEGRDKTGLQAIASRFIHLIADLLRFEAYCFAEV
jgi:hypothetical protein